MVSIIQSTTRFARIRKKHRIEFKWKKKITGEKN